MPGLLVCLWPGMYGMGVFVFELDASFYRLHFDCIYDLRASVACQAFQVLFSVFQEGI